MVKKFGTTWWGQQWLNALTDIDYSNRLPRGARYARNGSVKQIEFNGNRITAKVAGSRRTPYKETIVIPAFEKVKAAKFVDSLADHPVILADLMQRKLNPQILDIASKYGLKVFPSSWNDLEMTCSCPDWAVPCKHLAAVIYKVSEEIDSDPFLVFRLHGLDLLAELRKRDMLSDSTIKNLEPVKIDTLLRTKRTSKPSKPKQEATEPPTDPKQKATQAATGPTSESKGKEAGDWGRPKADFSLLPQIGDDLLELLTPNPSFSISGDFKKTYAKQLGFIGKKADSILSQSLSDPDENINLFPAGADIAFAINAHYGTEVFLTDEAGESIRISLQDFLDRLSRVRPSSYLTAQPWLEPIHKLWILAVNLIAKRDIVPLITTDGNMYRIIWQPAMLHPEIRRCVSELIGCIPGAVHITKTKTLENSGEWLLWNFLNALIEQFSGATEDSDDPLFNLFFLDDPQKFDSIGQTSVPGAIKVWTDKFFLLDREGEILMVIEDKKGKFQLSLSVDVSAPEQSIGRRIPFPELMQSQEIPANRKMAVMTKLSALCDYLPDLRPYLSDGGKKPMTFSPQTFPVFLMKTAPLMRLLGVEVALPKSLQELIRPKVTVRVESKPQDGKTYVRLDELLTFNWEIALGDSIVSRQEFDSLMIHAGELVKFKSSYIYVTPEELEKLRKQLAKDGNLTPQQLLAIALTESYDGAPVSLSDECRRLLEDLRIRPAVTLPKNLNAELRPYQKRGYEWMMHNLTLGFGAIIADDMGLGKTLQVISVLLKLKESGRLTDRKALIVVPTGLLTNWMEECSRFAPELAVDLYHGPSRNLKNCGGEILLTSYGVARSDGAKLKKQPWEVIVIDEAQNIKNPAAAQSKAINAIPANGHIAMSGTPVENRLSEYWSIMNFANKGYLGTMKDFNSRYGRPIQIEGDEKAAERFKAATAPFMLRRLKSDKSIISDLPDKIERDEYAALTPEQSALYQETLDEAMREISGITDTDSKSLFKREGLVLQMIMALKQICNHPAQFLKTGQPDADLSGKSMMLVDLVRAITESGEKVLIFTQFKEMGDLLAKMLEKEDIKSMFYHGGCSVNQRKDMVERFQNNRSAQVFILSLKAAGTGLNLTAATNVIHYDLWWNPAVEAQATDRAYRIGQHSNVQVYRFITKGTFEEKINAMIQDKKRLSDLTVGTGETWMARMSDDELRSIFALDPKK